MYKGWTPYDLRADPAALRRVAEIILVAALAVQGARLTWTLALPLGPVGDAPKAADSPAAIRDMGVLSRFDPFFRAGAPAISLDAPGGSSGGHQLFGVRTDASGRGSAILAGADGVQRSYALGETLPDGSRLTRIAPDHVILSDGGSRVRIGFPILSATAGPVASTPAPSPADAPIASILQPQMRDGRLMGFVVPSSGAGAALSGAGLQPGDVLLSVNGVETTSGGRLAQAGEAMASGEAELRFERGGKTFTTKVRPQ